MKNKLFTLVISAILSVSSFASFASFEKVEEALDEGNLKVAQLTFNELTESEKNSLLGQILVGRLLLQKEAGKDAFDHFEGLVDINSENVEVNFYLGISSLTMLGKAGIFSALGHAKDFSYAMEKTLKLKPDHIGAHLNLIGFHVNAPGIAGGDKGKALELANQLKIFDAEQGYGALARVYVATEQTELAQQTLQQGLKEFPKSFTLYFRRAGIYLRDDDWDKARADTASAINHAKNDNEKVEALWQLGKASAKSGKEIDLGIKSLIEAISLLDEQGPDAQWVKYRLAELYIHNGEWGKAKDYLTKIDNQYVDDNLKSQVKKLKKRLKKLKN